MLRNADSGAEGCNVVVGVIVAERVLGCVKEILSVNERNNALGWWFSEHSGKE